MRSMIQALTKGVPLRFLLFASLIGSIDFMHANRLHHIAINEYVNVALNTPSFAIAVAMVFIAIYKRLTLPDLSFMALAIYMTCYYLLKGHTKFQYDLQSEIADGLLAGITMLMAIHYIDGIKAFLVKGKEEQRD